jgi:hypothetical protein
MTAKTKYFTRTELFLDNRGPLDQYINGYGNGPTMWRTRYSTDGKWTWPVSSNFVRNATEKDLENYHKGYGKMQKTLTVNGKRFTAKQIIKMEYTQLDGGDYATFLNERIYFWNFRRYEDDFSAPVCAESDANCIVLSGPNSTNFNIWMSL